jgi:hypothetical protein
MSRPKHGTALLGIPETRREDEVPEIGALQHKSVAIVGVADLVGHCHEEIMQARLPARWTSRGSPGGRNDRRMLIGKILDRGGVNERLVVGNRKDDVRLR